MHTQCISSSATSLSLPLSSSCQMEPSVNCSLFYKQLIIDKLKSALSYSPRFHLLLCPCLAHWHTLTHTLRVSGHILFTLFSNVLNALPTCVYVLSTDRLFSIYIVLCVPKEEENRKWSVFFSFGYCCCCYFLWPIVHCLLFGFFIVQYGFRSNSYFTLLLLLLMKRIEFDLY